MRRTQLLRLSFVMLLAAQTVNSPKYADSTAGKLIAMPEILAS